MVTIMADNVPKLPPKPADAEKIGSIWVMSGRVKAMLNLDIVREATRLTRAGKLVEATALLQRMLRRQSPPDTTARTGRIALTVRELPIIDAKANTLE
jgi:hypothetical protein